VCVCVCVCLCVCLCVCVCNLTLVIEIISILYCIKIRKKIWCHCSMTSIEISFAFPSPRFDISFFVTTFYSMSPGSEMYAYTPIYLTKNLSDFQPPPPPKKNNGHKVYVHLPLYHFSQGATAHSGPGSHYRVFIITLSSGTSYSVGLPWLSNQPDAENTT